MSNTKAQVYPGFSQRMLAHNIDLVIMLPLYWTASYFIENNFILFGICFSLYILYHSLFELTKWKATPGKKLQKICLRSESGDELPIHLIFVRNLSKLLSCVIFFGGFAMISWDPKRRALHDRIVGAVMTFC